MGKPLGTPLSTGTSRSFSFSKIFFPWHALHLPPSPIIYPCPLHLSQFFWTCWYMPGPIWNIWTTLPFPLQVLHVYTFFPPFPLHASQHLVRLCFIFNISPLYMFSRVIFKGFWVALTFAVPRLCCLPPPPPPKNMLRRSSPPPCCGPFFPNLSYIFLLLGSSSV